jgi:hypothetical protein
MKFMNLKHPKNIGIYFGAVVLIGLIAWYLYSNILNSANARNLKLPGLRDLVCNGVPYEVQSGTCGNRALFSESDFGVTSYITIYGVDSREEAEQMAARIKAIRKENRQEDIPVNLRVYSSPRSSGREPSESKIYDKVM